MSTATGLRPRMKNPAMIIPEAMQAIQALHSATQLSDRADPVPDEIWDEAARHYDERALAALILMIATTNVFIDSTSPRGRSPGHGDEQHRRA